MFMSSNTLVVQQVSKSSACCRRSCACQMPYLDFSCIYVWTSIEKGSQQISNFQVCLAVHLFRWMFALQIFLWLCVCAGHFDMFIGHRVPDVLVFRLGTLVLRDTWFRVYWDKRILVDGISEALPRENQFCATHSSGPWGPTMSDLWHQRLGHINE